MSTIKLTEIPLTSNPSSKNVIIEDLGILKRYNLDNFVLGEDLCSQEWVKNRIAEAQLDGKEVDLSGFAEKKEIPIYTSQLINDSDFAIKKKLPIVVQNTGNDKNAVMSQAAVTSMLDNLTLLPYGGSKEWLDDNGDINQLYQIDGYIWAYIDATGWTRTAQQYIIVSNESEMVNDGGIEYLLKNGNQGTVYSYKKATGDIGIPIVEKLPESPNNGDIIVLQPTIVNSVEEMIDTSKNYTLNNYIWEFGTQSKDPSNLYDPTKITIGKRHSGSPGTIVSGTIYVMTDFIPINMQADIPAIKIKAPLIGAFGSTGFSYAYQKAAFYDSSKTILGSNYMEAEGVKTVYENGYATIYPDTIANTKPSYYDQIAFVRIEFTCPSTATMEDGKAIESIIDVNDTSQDIWYNTYKISGQKYRAEIETKYFEFNAYDESTSLLNTRINSSGSIVSKNGMVLTRQIEQTYDIDCIITIKGIDSLVPNYGTPIGIHYFDASGVRLGFNTAQQLSDFISNGNINVPITFHPFKVTANNAVENITDTAYIAIQLGVTEDTEISFADCSNLKVNFPNKNYYKDVINWIDIGTYIPPTEAGWEKTELIYKIIYNLSDISVNNDKAIYNEDGYIYIYLSGANWIQTSKYNDFNIIIDGDFSNISTNALQNRVITAAVNNINNKINNNDLNIDILNQKIANIETNNNSLSVPTVWKNAVDTCIAKIKSLQKGKNCVTFPFFSDNHQRNGYAGQLIAYIMKECHIPYCFFGGDSISSGYIEDEATMIAQDKAFDTIMSYVPNGRFCRTVGNHDGYWAVSASEKYWYSRDKVYDLFLREESIAQNKHFGSDGTYYYIDDIASKVRWIVINANAIRNESGKTDSNTINTEQLNWIENVALKFNEPGWAVVLISHQPLSNHYHAGINNVNQVMTMFTNYKNSSYQNKADLVGCYSGHIHRDRIYTGLAINTSDDSQGAAMPFTQVTITSDANIDYDRLGGATGMDRNMNGDTSHAIDFITINKDTGTVNITRLGMGNDRSYQYK